MAKSGGDVLLLVMSARFVNIDRNTPLLLPPDLRDWLPQDHLVHFVVEVVQSMDCREFKVNERGTGSRQYPPGMMLALLVYCYATGRFSSRMIEAASYEDVAVRYICAGEHPDHDTICTFRRVNREVFERFFVHVLEVAMHSGVLKKVGTVSVDGTKLKANASKHSAMSHARAQQELVRLEQEVAILTGKAEQADRGSQVACETRLPEEIARREKRLASIRKAVEVIEARAREKAAVQQQQRDALARDRRERRGRGQTVRGREPKPVEPKVDSKAQYNFTDPQSRIMKTRSGFEQCYNAQAAVETASMLVVANALSNQANDHGQLVPLVEQAALNGVSSATVLADSGYYSKEQVESLESKGIDVLVAVGRQKHGRSLEAILGEEADQVVMPAEQTVRERMQSKVNSREGRRVYGLRKQTVEPVFGIIKGAMRFRQCLMRGVRKVASEWNLVCSAYNVKRIFNLLSPRAASACAAAVQKCA